MQPDSRQCTKCAAQKPLSEFSKAPGGKYGRKSRCKACDAAYAAANNHKRRLPSGEVERRLQTRRGTNKTCSVCGESKDRSRFSKSRDGKYGPVLRSECKECRSTQAVQWFRDNADRHLETNRNWRLPRTYGISSHQYETMLAFQNGVCAICGQNERAVHGSTGMPFNLSIDHDHGTGQIRGLLCQRCNRAIGLLGDDAAVAQRAAEYLLRHKEIPAE